MNKGFNVNHANTGKKCIGITSPGNNSGAVTSSGSFAPNAGSILANDNITNTKLKMISAFVLNHLSNSQLPTPASRQPTVLDITMPAGMAIFEKSTPNEDE